METTVGADAILPIGLSCEPTFGMSTGYPTLGRNLREGEGNLVPRYLGTLVRWYDSGHTTGDHSLVGGAKEPAAFVPILSACVCFVWQARQRPTRLAKSR